MDSIHVTEDTVQERVLTPWSSPFQ